MRLLVALLLGVSIVSCAKKAPPVAVPPAPIDLSSADALLEAGCYTCLLDAFPFYERALAQPALRAGAREKAFVTAVLLAVREKEIGLEATPWLERAHSLAVQDELTYLEIVSSVEWTNAGATDDFERPRRPSDAAVEVWRGFLTAPEVRHPVLAQYLLLVTSCGRGGQTIQDIVGRVDTTHRPVRYRLGLCSTAQRPHLEAVFEADPRYAEAAFYIARYEMGNFADRRWLVRAVPPMVAAHDGLPMSPVVTVGLAGLMRSRGELERALGLYDEALQIRPTQRDALLGRVITLSYLERHDEAVASATRMIDLGRWHVGSAYYWRAWNHFQSGRVAEAGMDIAESRRLQVNADVMTLSGQVAYAQERPRDARVDFSDAIRMDDTKCLAHWYLGILDLDEQAWKSAIGTFSTSGTCFQAAANALRAESEALPPDLPDAAREQQMGSYDQNILTNLRQAGRSFLNAAGAAVRAGEYDIATERARSALDYEEVRERAGTLLVALQPRKQERSESGPASSLER